MRSQWRHHHCIHEMREVMDEKKQDRSFAAADLDTSRWFREKVYARLFSRERLGNRYTPFPLFPPSLFSFYHPLRF